MIWNLRALAEAFGAAGTIGLTLAGCIFVGVAMGVYLDRWWHTQPWFMLIFMTIGIIAGFYNVIKLLPSQKRKLK